MVDATQILDAKRAEIAVAEAALNVMRAELRGMEAMAKALPFSRGSEARGDRRDDGGGATQESKGGRQVGSISKRWRTALWRLHSLGGDFSASDIVGVVRDLEGREMRAADARRQMDTYAGFGFIAEAGNDRYNVTSKFKSKFADHAPNGFDENAPPSSVFDDVLGGAETAHHALDRRPQE